MTLLGDPLPAPLDLIAESTDDEGRNLTQFTYHLLMTAINRGLRHILVDYPAQSPATAKIEQEQKVKPLLLVIDPKNLIDWQYSMGPGEQRPSPRSVSPRRAWSRPEISRSSIERASA